jgi:hypothetical protein
MTLQCAFLYDSVQHYHGFGFLEKKKNITVDPRKYTYLYLYAVLWIQIRERFAY